MKNFNALLLLFLLTLVFTGCDKDEDKEPTKEQLLMAKNWNATSIPTSGTISTPFGSSQFQLDYITQMNACQKDNFLKFEANGKVIMNEGPSKCSPGDPQTLEGTWSLTDNLLTIQGNVLKNFNLSSSTPVTLTIQELTSQTLKVNTTQPINYQGLNVNATINIIFEGQ
jgi:hypothetical protein